MSKRWECPKCNRLYPSSLSHCPKCNSSNNHDIIKNIKNNHEKILSSSKKIHERHKK